MGEDIGLGVLKDLLGSSPGGTFHLEFNGVDLGEVQGFYPIVDNPPIPEENYVETLSKSTLDLTLKDKPISKKRFIKLLMGQHNIQRNEAIKMHNEFMKEYKQRTEITMLFFIISYNTETLGDSINNLGKKAYESAKSINKLGKVVSENDKSNNCI